MSLCSKFTALSSSNAHFPCLHNSPMSLSKFSRKPVKTFMAANQLHQRENPPLRYGRWRRQIPDSVVCAVKTRTPVATEEADSEELPPLPADIRVTAENEPNSRVKLSVEVPAVVCRDCYDKLLADITKKSKVPGFRPGKEIPESILVSYVGEENVRKAAIEAILEKTLPHALSSVRGRALNDSVRILTDFTKNGDDGFFPGQILRYDVVVDVVPEVKWTSPDAYKNLKLVIEIDQDILPEKACDKELRRRHKALGALRIITDRGLQVGDVTILDIFASTIEENDAPGERIPSADRKGFHLDTEEGEDLLPGFLDAIVGIQRGEIRSFQLVFPESWKQENLCGLEAQFTVECKELFYRDLPQLDDSLAEKLLPGCNTLTEVRESIFERCQQMQQEAKEQAIENVLLDELTKVVDVDVPQSLIKDQGRQLYGAKLLELQGSVKLDERQLRSLSSEKAVEEFIEAQKDHIIRLVKQMFAVGEIFKAEKLQLSIEELKKEVVNTVSELKKHKQDYDEKRVTEQVQDILENAKVLEWLKQHADIQYVTK